MTAVDVTIVLAVLVVGALGWHDGLVRAVLAYTGFLLGAAVGMALVPLLLGHLSLSIWVALVAVFVVAAGAVGGREVAVLVSRRVRARMGWEPRRWIDRPGGAVLGAVAALGVSWMLGLALAGSALPDVSAAANRSVALRLLDRTDLPISHLVIRRFEAVSARTDFPRYVDVLTAERIVPVPAPPKSVAKEAAVVRASASVWRIYAQRDAMSANEGTAFLVAPGRLMTAAHVVAGSDDIRVDLTPRSEAGSRHGKALSASIVACDPEQDVAVLDVPGLTGRPLDFTSARSGDPAVVVGFPGDGPLTRTPARVRDRQEWQSSDIDGDGRYVHDAYTVRGRVRGGDSGGPLVAPDGRVLGVVVASSRSDEHTGYVLTADQVSDALAAGRAGAPHSADDCGPEKR